MARTEPARGMRDFLPEDVRRREYVIAHHQARLRALRIRAARDAGGREHRDAAGEVRRRRQPAHFQDPQARRARGERPGRPGAPLRPDGAAGARRRAVSEQAAAALQALSDPAGVARRSAGARAVPRVLPVRRRLARLDLAGGRSRVVRGRVGCADRTRLQRLRHPDQSPAVADGAARAWRVSAEPLHGDALVALDKFDKIGRDGVAGELAQRGIARAGPERCSDDVSACAPVRASAGRGLERLDALARCSTDGHASDECPRRSSS